MLKLDANVRYKESWEELSPEEAKKIIDSEKNSINELERILRREYALAQGIVYSYENFIGYWKAFDESKKELDEYIYRKPQAPIEERKIWEKFLVSTGNLQKVLRHELISIRDKQS